MKLAVISDIHSNPDMLNAALATAEQQQCEKVICLGDIVGYGYDPEACINICRERGIECIKGNHDAGLVGDLSIEWFSATAKNALKAQMTMISDENKDWLKSLPYTLVKEYNGWRVGFTHGTFRDAHLFEYILDSVDAAIEIMEFQEPKTLDSYFFGHTHGAVGYYLSASGRRGPEVCYVPFELKGGEKVELADDARWTNGVFNPGSVGYPRQSKHGSFIVYDTDTCQITWHGIEWDIKSYIQGLENKGLKIPEWVKDRQQRYIYSEALKQRNIQDGIK